MKTKEKKRVIIPFRPVLRWLIRLRRSPRAIAGGFALGTFIAFTPTIGFQVGIAIFFATIFNLNRPAAALAVFISNPATMVPLYTFNYSVGTWFWHGPPVKEVFLAFSEIANTLITLSVLDASAQFETIRQLSFDILAPLLIGCTLTGIVAAGIAYATSLLLIYLLQKRKAKKALEKLTKTSK